MDLLIVVSALVYGVIIEAKEFLRTGHGDDISISDNSSEEKPSQLVALLILEHNDDSEESDQSFSYYQPNNLNPIDGASSDADTDTSGDSNSDEYDDTDTEDTQVSNTDSESSYYHENDYDEIVNERLKTEALAQGHSTVLRKRWKSCIKAGSKACKEACVVAYKNSCDQYKCKKKLKKILKKECKRNCKDFFQ